MSRHLMILGGVMALLGILCIYAPGASGQTVAVVVGAFLIVGGLFRAIFAFLTVSWGSALFGLLSGGLAVAAGTYMILKPEGGAEALAVVAVIYFIVDGLGEAILGFLVPPVAGGGWLIFGGAVSIGLGVLIWAKWSLVAGATVGLIVGVKLILDGLMLLVVGFAAKSVKEAITARA